MMKLNKSIQILLDRWCLLKHVIQCVVFRQSSWKTEVNIGLDMSQLWVT